MGELTKLERLLKDDPQMEWYYDYATGQLHNGVGWAYNLANDKLENNGQKIETLDHLTALGQNTHEIDNGSNAGFFFFFFFFFHPLLNKQTRHPPVVHPRSGGPH